jgi:hypothetical protein
MTDTNTTAPTAIVPATPSTALSRGPLRPVARPVDIIEAHKEAASLIREALEDGRDYGAIPGAGPKKVLLKPGAERLCTAFGLRPTYDVVSYEADHDRVVEFHDRRRGPSTSAGLYRYVVKCKLERDGIVVGEGVGSCSTMEQKYVSRPRDSENTVLKMAKKRALVDAVLGTLSLSDRFTQDVGDDEEDDTTVVAAPASRSANREALIAEVTAAFDALQVPLAERKEHSRRILGHNVVNVDDMVVVRDVLREQLEARARAGQDDVVEAQ